MTKTIDRWEANKRAQAATFRVRAGIRIATDGRLNNGGFFSPLEISGLEGTKTGSWPYRIAAQNGIPALACRVEITGTTVRFNASRCGNTPVIRARVTYAVDAPGGLVDGVSVGAWVIAADRDRPEA